MGGIANEICGVCGRIRAAHYDNYQGELLCPNGRQGTFYSDREEATRLRIEELKQRQETKKSFEQAEVAGIEEAIAQGVQIPGIVTLTTDQLQKMTNAAETVGFGRAEEAYDGFLSRLNSFRLGLIVGIVAAIIANRLLH